VAFAVGIVAGRYARIGMPAALALGAAAGMALVVGRRRLGEGVRTLLVLVLVGAAGTADYGWRAAASRHRARHALPGLLASHRTLCDLLGTVEGEASVARVTPLIDTPDTEVQQVSTLRLAVDEIASNGRAVSTTGDVEVRVTGPLRKAGHGDRVRVFGWLTPLDPDRAHDRYAASTGLVARAWVSGPDAIRVERRSPGSFFRFLYALKQSFRDQIDAHFPADEGAGSDTPVVLKAVLLGDRERLGRRLGGMFNKSGTTHVLAISGLHVGIVYLAAVGLCRLLLIRRWPRRVIVLGLVCSYGVMIGLRPATIRAMLMIALLEFGDALKFRREPVNAVAAAALVLLAWAPHHLFEAGFQLTFVAVLGILMFSRHVARFLQGEPDELERLVEPEFRSRWSRAAGRLRRTVSRTLGTCAAATLAVLPLQAHYFNIVTPVSVVATAVLFPVIFSLIFVGFVFLALAPFVPALAALVAKLLGLIAVVFTGVVDVASEVPFGHAFVASPPAGWVWLFYLGLLVVAARGWLRLRPARAVAVPACVLCIYLGWRALTVPGPELAATFVDVGHGACVVVTRRRSTVVYDCGTGTPFTTYDVGRGPAAGCLWEKGVKRIDLLVLSHTDADHVNGVLSLVDRFPVGRVVVNRTFGKNETGRALKGAFSDRGIPCAEAGAGDRLGLGELEMRVLWPPRGSSGWQLGAVNDRSLVLRMTRAGRSLLLTGDIERVGLAGLLTAQTELDSEVLYVPHHGAEEPVLAEFVRTVDPDVAVISADREDTTPAVLELFQGVRLYQTYEDGTVTLRADERGWRAEAARHSLGLNGR
jgi:competence protein ComEC